MGDNPHKEWEEQFKKELKVLEERAKQLGRKYKQRIWVVNQTKNRKRKKHK